ncbi:MAG: hypothetical protein PQJ61_11845 [Spirochaetales bacterium]|uniref:Uncharacterized protein n=1 Tax=Candidatus Thalassospirochaeta sargassi TaxID=3119039 RepID=A0AAJ1ML38_9SPIO|nr:hypothetical protein [Spirochaetales bacterium]
MIVDLSAQSGSLDLSYIENKKLSINMTTRILGDENETIWHMDSSKITVSGEAVKVKLSGGNLIVIANITPYLNSDNTLFLVAKGEIFMTDSADSEEVKYYTTLKSLPVTVGEKVIFFPLGMAYDSNSNFYSMEMEIQVQSVEDPDDSAKVE